MLLERTIHSRIKDYKVHYSQGFGFVGALKEGEGSFFVIDRKVFGLYGKLFGGIPEERLILFDALEENKVLASCEAMYGELMARSARRGNILVSIGGGITQDVTGFVASTLYRGMRWAYVPTTLLAQADSCIGSKTSLNFGKFKNLVGTFYPPDEIYVDSGFVSTLSPLDFRSGMGEIVKLKLMALHSPEDIKGAAEAAATPQSDIPGLQRLVHEAIDIKLSYLEGDEFDRGRRNLLNFGHCFGHALEAASKYEVPHGVAVMVGILYANCVSLRRGFLRADDAEAMAGFIIPALGMGIRKRHLEPGPLLEAMKSDKKRAGKDLALILLGKELAPLKVTDHGFGEFEKALGDLSAALEKGGALA